MPPRMPLDRDREREEGLTSPPTPRRLGAGNGIRIRDPQLGKRLHWASRRSQGLARCWKHSWRGSGQGPAVPAGTASSRRFCYALATGRAGERCGRGAAPDGTAGGAPARVVHGERVQALCVRRASARPVTQRHPCAGECGRCDRASVSASGVPTRGMIVDERAVTAPRADRRLWDAGWELFSKLVAGTASQGWLALPPGTPARSVRVVR